LSPLTPIEGGTGVVEIAEGGVVVVVAVGWLERDAAVEQVGHRGSVAGGGDESASRRQPAQGGVFPEHALGALVVDLEPAARRPIGHHEELDPLLLLLDREALGVTPVVARLPPVRGGGVADPLRDTLIAEPRLQIAIARLVMEPGTPECGDPGDVVTGESGELFGGDDVLGERLGQRPAGALWSRDAADLSRHRCFR